MAIIVRNNPPPKKEEPKKIGSITAANIQIKNQKEPPKTGDVHIKANPSSVTAVKKDGTVLKKYPYNLYLNDQKIEMDNNLHEMINKLVKEI